MSKGAFRGIILVCAGFKDDNFYPPGSCFLPLNSKIHSAFWWRIGMKDKNRERERLAKELEKAKKKLEELEDWEGRYKALFDRSLYCVFVHDLEGNYIDANKVALNLLGYKKQDIPHLNFTSLLDEEQIPLVKKTLAEIIKSGCQNEPTKYKLKRKDGGYAWVETDATLIYKKGEPFGILGIARDITEYKKTERALRESEEKYRKIFESLTDVYYRTDREGIVTEISPSVYKQSGWDPEDVVGHPVTDFYRDPSSRDIFANTLKEKGVINDYELQLLAKDKKVIEVSVSSHNVFDDQGQALGVEGVLRDITTRKQADEQIKASLREKEVMLREIHHRVKNNMQIILSLLRIQSRTIKDRRTREMFKQSQNRIRSMALIHEALYKSKDLAMIDIADYISRMTTHLLSIYKKDLGEIEIKQKAEGVFLDINRAIPCGLIISELVSNCLKHAFTGKKEGQITIRMATDKKGINRLVVKDNGTGLPEGLAYREAETLGLQLVTDLVQQINGSIELKKTHGTEFIVKF